MAPHAEINEFANGNGFTSNNAGKELFTVNSPNVVYTDSEINTKYTYRTTAVTKDESGKYIATPKETLYDFKVDRKVPKTGVMLVGWGGNNGTSFDLAYFQNHLGLVTNCSFSRNHRHRGYHCQSSRPYLGYS